MEKRLESGLKEQVIKEYLNEIKGSISERSLYCYSIDLKKMIEYMNEEKVPISKKAIEGYLVKIRESDYASRTKERKTRVITRFAESHGYKINFESSLANQVELSEKTLLPHEEIEMFMRFVEDQVKKQRKPNRIRDNAIFELMVNYGFSIEEINSLNTSDLNLKNKILIVNGDIYPIAVDEVLFKLEMYMEIRDQFHPSSEKLFLSKYGTELRNNSLLNVFREYSKNACLTIEFTPHVLGRSVKEKYMRKGLSYRSYIAFYKETKNKMYKGRNEDMEEYIVKVCDSDNEDYVYSNANNNFMDDYIDIAMEVDQEYWPYFASSTRAEYAKEFLAHGSGIVLMYAPVTDEMNKDKVVGFIQLKGIYPSSMAAIKNDVYHKYELDSDDVHPALLSPESVGTYIEVVYIQKEFRNKGLLRRALLEAFSLIGNDKPNLLTGVAVTKEGKKLLERMGLEEVSYSQRDYFASGEKCNQLDKNVNHRWLFVGNIEKARKMLTEISKNNQR